MTFLKILLQLYLMFRFYIWILLIAIIGLIIAKKLGYIKGGNKSKSLPKSTPCGRLSSRLPESIMLACTAAIFIGFSLYVELPRFLSTVGDDVKQIYITFIAALCAVTLLGVLITLLWRASVGFVVVIIACFMIFLTGTRSIDPVALSGIEPASEKTIEYVFTLNNDLVGADLWVNDVYLGKTPVKTTLQEFLKKVPYWSEPPEGINDIAQKETLNYKYNDGWSSTDWARCFSFVIPKMPETYSYEPAEKIPGESIDDFSNREQINIHFAKITNSQNKDTSELKRTYYARVQLGDAVGYGYCSGSGGLGSSVGGGKISYNGSCNFSAFFPLREKRIETLLDIARLKNYEVGDDWFEAIQSFGDEGWDALKNAAYFDWINSTKQYYVTNPEPVPSEPGMIKLMDEWACRRYRFEKSLNEKAAWNAFQKVCAESDKQRSYSSSGIAGWAVEMLVPELDEKQLMNWALGRVKSYAFHSFAWDRLWYSQRFETRFNEEDYKNREVRASDYIAAHAVYEMDKFLDKKDDESYNIIEKEISKAILVWQGPVDHASFLLAAAIDGPDLVPYFKKCYIASKRGDERLRNSVSTSGLRDINLWLYLIAQLTGPEAENFKMEYISDMTDMTLRLALEDNAFSFNRLEYLSLDTDNASESLGSKLWPQYKQLIESSQDKMGAGNLYKLWRYLFIIEPVMPAQTYAQCWRDNKDTNRNFRNAIDILNILPVEKRRLVLEELIEEVRERPENLIRPGNTNGRNSSDEPDTSEVNYVLQKLERELVQLDDVEFADYVIQENTKYSSTLPENMTNWLEKMRPGHVIAKVMAQSEDFRLRVTSVRLLKSFPIPEQVTILEKLSKDSDSTVKQSAESALSELDNLTQIPLTLLAAETDVETQKQINGPASVFIRAYTNLPEDDSAFKLIEADIKVVRELSSLNESGLPEYKIKGLELPQIDSSSFPPDTVFLIDSVDQKNSQVAQALGNRVYNLSTNNTRLRNINAKSQPAMVTLIDAQGNPIPNASVDFILNGRFDSETITLTGHKSDEYGKLGMIDINGRYLLRTIKVTHPDYGTLNIEYLQSADKKEIKVPMFKSDSLNSSRAVYGIVVDANDQPVAGAKVVITGVKTVYSIAPVSSNDAFAFTDEQGRFNIYPSGQNVADPPLLTEYEIRVDTPKDYELPPFSGLYKNGEESKIVLKQNGYFHTFTFEDINGPITDENILSRISLNVTGNDGKRLELRGDILIEGGYVPLGKYTPYMSDNISFESFEITKESPVNILCREKAGKTFRGKVVHGVAGEPVAGAFVFLIDAIGSSNMAKITKEQWEILHQQPYGSLLNEAIIEFIDPMYMANSLLRTDDKGCFEVPLRARNHYTFVTFEENYMPYRYRLNGGDIPNNEIVEMQDMKLFPAAKVKLGFEEFKNAPEAMPVPIIDFNNSPDWAKIFEDTGSFEFSSWHSFRSPTWLYVPADVTFQLSLKPSYSGHSNWSSITVLPEKIHLEQGQTLDLGLVRLDEAIPVIVKVVNSKDEPIEGVSITKYQYEDNVKYGIGQTDPNGIIRFSLNSNSKGEILARLNLNDVAAKTTFSIGGQEDSEREFKLVIPE